MALVTVAMSPASDLMESSRVGMYKCLITGDIRPGIHVARTRFRLRMTTLWGLDRILHMQEA